MQRHVIGWCAAGLVLLAGAGCGTKSGTSGKPPPQDTQAKIQAIQNNPHIPAQMKAGIIARMQQPQTGLAGNQKK